ncbi:hypothetical protein CISG_04888 [Coccidioides immitis RMSCC 3703]|uniref:Uncharacterized protein n=1 Tax=Coccidioides immitis RMSCC 3703 TaxID=454286 RepID=A0A0J8QSG6_COCIT|nr:hypothetical protein CISG_04888 [Coccidioides immitis RMSCC 3703]
MSIRVLRKSLREHVSFIRVGSNVLDLRFCRFEPNVSSYGAGSQYGVLFSGLDSAPVFLPSRPFLRAKGYNLMEDSNSAATLTVPAT